VLNCLKKRRGKRGKRQRGGFCMFLRCLFPTSAMLRKAGARIEKEKGGGESKKITGVRRPDCEGCLFSFHEASGLNWFILDP